MGAGQSEIAYNSAVTAAGYTSITDSEEDIPKSTSFAEANEYCLSNTIIKTPFHANWHMHEGAFYPPSPRMGTAFVYNPNNHRIYYAFGEKANNEYSTELVCYDIGANTWSTVIQDLGIGRSHATATLIGNDLYIFGGNNNETYYNQLIKVNLNTNEFSQLQGHGEVPSPRNNAVIGNFNGKIYIWGGFSKVNVDSNIYVYDLKSNTWSIVDCDFTPRPTAGFTQIYDKIYIYGSHNTDGMLILDLQKCAFELIPKKGSYPQITLNYPSVVACGSNYILCFGGTSDFVFSHLFAYDVLRRWWFLFHIKPVMNDQHKGEISDIGLFKVPRNHSAAAVYDTKNRQIIYTFGSKLDQDSPLGIFEMAKGIAQCNQREDMVAMLR